MTPFEIIILFIYWLFATTYAYKNISTDIDDAMTLLTKWLISMLSGAFVFPVILANDLWNKLNKV